VIETHDHKGDFKEWRARFFRRAGRPFLGNLAGLDNRENIMRRIVLVGSIAVTLPFVANATTLLVAEQSQNGRFKQPPLLIKSANGACDIIHDCRYCSLLHRSSS
jgi:hypothetical protein